MSAWKRPSSFEDALQERAALVVEESEIDDVEEAFVSGALWAALVAEERISIDEGNEDDDDN